MSENKSVLLSTSILTSIVSEVLTFFFPFPNLLEGTECHATGLRKQQVCVHMRVYVCVSTCACLTERVTDVWHGVTGEDECGSI